MVNRTEMCAIYNTSTTLHNHYRVLDQIIGVFCLFVGISSVVLNLYIMYFFIKAKQLLQGVGPLLFQIAFIDCLAGFISLILARHMLVSKITYTPLVSTFWTVIMDIFFCQLGGIMLASFSVSAPLLLALITSWRVIAVLFPHKYAYYFSRYRKAQWMCYLLVWVWATLGAIMPYIQASCMCYFPEWAYCDYKIAKIFTAVPDQTAVIVSLLVVPQVLSFVLIVVGSLVVSFKMLTHAHTRAKKDVMATSGMSNNGGEVEGAQQESKVEGAQQESEAQAPEMSIKSGRLSRHISSKSSKFSLGISKLTKSMLDISELEKREKNVVWCTLFLAIIYFSSHFVWVAYTLVYLVHPNENILRYLSGNSELGNVFIYNWYYLAHPLAALANAITQIKCNNEMNKYLSSLIRCKPCRSQ